MLKFQVTPTTKTLVVCIMLAAISFGLMYPTICDSAQFGVSMNTLGLALFVLCTLDSQEYDGTHANQRHVMFSWFSNRLVGAAMMLCVVTFVVASNVHMMSHARMV